MSVFSLGWPATPSVSRPPFLPLALVGTVLAALLTAAPGAAQTCAGDCNGNGVVSNDEMLVGANVALGTLNLRSCPSVDASGDGSVRINEAVAAAGRRANGCAAARTGTARNPRTPSPQIELGVVAGSAGAHVTFDTTLHTMGSEVAGIENVIDFDPLTPIISCEENPDIDKSVFAAFRPFGCTVGVDCTSVKLLVLSLSNVDPIPDGSVIYRCTVAINLAAPDGTYPLDSSLEGASDPDGNALPLEGIDGAVVVAGGAICAGDCNGDGQITINEIVTGYRILFDVTPLSACPAADINGSGTVTIDESQAAVGNAIDECGTHPTGLPGGTAQIEIGIVSGTAGTQVTFDVTLHTVGGVSATQNDIAFDPSTPIVSCEENPAINKGQTDFEFMPTGCSPGFDCTSVRAAVSSFSNFDPIPDGSVLYTCTIDISSFAFDGFHPLPTFLLHGSTPGGRPVSVSGIDGGVITTGGAIPPTPTPTPDVDASIVIGDASGIAGQITTVDVGLETNGEIAGVQNDMFFDDTAPIFFSSCEVNPDIDKDQTAFSFRPFDCVPEVNCSGVRALVLSFFNVDPIPDGSIMYSCNVFILPSAAPGDYPLVCSNDGASDPDGNAIETECIDGTVTVLGAGPPVAPATLILKKARLRSRPQIGGSVLLSGVVNANPPFGGLGDDITSAGLSIQVTGAGGVDVTLSWEATACSTRQTPLGPRVRCEVSDGAGKRKIVLRPTRVPNLLRMKMSASRLSLMGPFTADPVTANLQTTSFQRPDTINSCDLRHQGAVTSCSESGIVP